MPLTELLELMVVHSDNSAVDAFFRIGGGAPAMATRFRRWRVEGIRIDRREEQIFLDSVQAQYPSVEQWTGEMYMRLMQQATPEARRRGMEEFLADARDTGTPNGTVHLLARLFRGELLSKASTALLIEMLKATPAGPKRLRGLLPEGTIVAHKTGLAGTANSVKGATNDVGVIFSPEDALAIAVFVKGSTRSESVREQVIAQIARAAYDFWA